MATVTEYRVAYDTRAFSETSTWEFPLADPSSRDEAMQRLGRAEEQERRSPGGRFNFRIQSRTVTYDDWKDEA